MNFLVTCFENSTVPITQLLRFGMLHFVFYRQSLPTPQDFFPRKTASEASGLCRRTRKKYQFLWMIHQNLFGAEKPQCVLKQFYVDFMGFFLCHYSLNIVLMRNKSQWETSHLYRRMGLEYQISWALPWKFNNAKHPVTAFPIDSIGFS